MKFWFGNPGWGWRLWGVSHSDKWFIGLSVKRKPNHDQLFHQKTTNSSSITHDNNCCCDCLDNGPSPDSCPCCKQSAEIEELRAEVERLRTDGATAVRWAPSSAHWSSVLRELFGLDARVGIDALEARWRAELERADTAEALLRQVLEVLEEARDALYEGHPVRVNTQEAIAALRERLGEGAEP